MGHTVNFKTTTKSYKSHKTIDLPKENWLIFENTHPAIIEKSVWDKVQELRKNKRKNTKSGNTSIFSGVLECIVLTQIQLGVIDIPQHFQELAI